MTELLAPHFLHPAVAAVGVGCVAVPIVVHLINRLRFKRVRFAAMEFLLQSEKRNRRRVLLEQLLLLLLRILLVLAAAALVARLVLDSSTLSVLRGGAAAHHVVVLDDSGSMRASVGEGTAFAAAKTALRDFAAEAARSPGSVQLTVLLLSRADADSALVARRDVTAAFLPDLAEKLDALAPTHARHRPAAGLDAALRRFEGEEDTGDRVVHLLGDFRTADWAGTGAGGEGEAAGDGGDAAAAVRRLDAAGVRVNLIRVVGGGDEEDNAGAVGNRRVADVSLSSPAVAVGVPVRVSVTVTNDGAAAGPVDLIAELDRQAIPVPDRLPAAEPGETVAVSFDVQFDEPGRHEVAVSLPGGAGDGLAEDDRFVRPVRVLPRVPVLAIDGAADLAGATAIRRVFDPELTGRTVRVGGPDLLRKEDLTQFTTVYVLNVPRLPPDAVGPLGRYVRGGGGLMWYAGNLDPAHYTDTLHEAGLFPVPLAGGAKDLPADPDAGPDVTFRPHPVTSVLTGTDNPFSDLVRVARYLPVPADWDRDDAARGDGVETLATLRDGAPLVLASSLGEGRVLAVLTTASTAWTDWPRNPAFPLFQLPAQEWAGRADSGDGVAEAGEPLVLQLDAARFRPDVLIERPDELSASLTASPRLEAGETGADGAPVTADELRLFAEYRDTDLPGTYKTRLETAAGEPADRWTGVNFPAAESALAVVSSQALLEALADTENVTVRDAADAGLSADSSGGAEPRWWLLGALAGLLAAEQLLAYRCSYHGADRMKGVAA